MSPASVGGGGHLNFFSVAGYNSPLKTLNDNQTELRFHLATALFVLYKNIVLFVFVVLFYLSLSAGGIIDRASVADGISIDGGRETAVRNVSIKHTGIGLHIKIFMGCGYLPL